MERPAGPARSRAPGSASVRRSPRRLADPAEFAVHEFGACHGCARAPRCKRACGAPGLAPRQRGETSRKAGAPDGAVRPANGLLQSLDPHLFPIGAAPAALAYLARTSNRLCGAYSRGPARQCGRLGGHGGQSPSMGSPARRMIPIAGIIAEYAKTSNKSCNIADRPEMNS